MTPDAPIVKKIALAALLIALAAAGRLVPHLPNATPMTAALFASSRRLGGRWAYGVAVAALLCSDAILGWYDWRVLMSVYGSFLVIAALGSMGVGRLARLGALAGSSVLFFLVTNAAVWAFTLGYAKDIGGLMLCYAQALPFLRNMLVGDFVYAAVLSGALYSLPLSVRVRHAIASYAS